MKLLYTAGPYRSKEGEYGVHRNIEEAGRIARILWDYGYAVICPHKNTAFYGGTDIDDQVWLDGDLEMLVRCDGIVMLPGWPRSSGACRELEVAQAAGLDIYFWSKDSGKLLEEVRSANQSAAGLAHGNDDCGLSLQRDLLRQPV